MDPPGQSAGCEWPASDNDDRSDSRVMPGILILIDAPRSPIAAPQRGPPSSNSRFAAVSYCLFSDAPRLTGDPPPTIANYTMVANQSLEKLDDLLTRQGSRNLSPTPIYTASKDWRLVPEEGFEPPTKGL